MKERSHHWPARHCYICGHKAVAYCDGVEHYIGDLERGVPKLSLENAEDCVVFCHKPICDDCATVSGMSTASGHVDTIDYCPKHAFKELHGIRPEIKIRG